MPPLVCTGLEMLWSQYGAGLRFLAALLSKALINILLLPSPKRCHLHSGLFAVSCHLLFLLFFTEPSTPSLMPPCFLFPREPAPKSRFYGKELHILTRVCREESCGEGFH